MNDRAPKRDIVEMYRWFYHRRWRPFLWRTYRRRQLSSLSNKAFLSLLGLPSDEAEAAKILNGRLKERFFFDGKNRKEFFLSLLTSTQPYDDVLDEADEVCDGMYEALGSGLVSIGKDPAWHKDFKSGYSWPVEEAHRLDILQSGRPSDIKVPWELSRFHQVWWLGKAFWLTRSERYVEPFKTLIESWMRANPVGRGVNWYNAMEASIRACNWMAGCAFFADAQSLTPGFWVRFWKGLYIHGVFIEHNIEYARRPGNHLVADVAGLVFLGVMFRDVPVGLRWLRWGTRQLEREMFRQVSVDGVHFEKSTGYHRFVLELFSSASILARRNGHRFSDAFEKRLRSMFAFMAALQRSDGTFAQVGDGDDGRLFRFRRKTPFNISMDALAVGTVLYDDATLKSVAGVFSQAALWLVGAEGFERFRRIPSAEGQPVSRLFPDGAFAILHSSRAHVTVHFDDAGMTGKPGHGHNDAFSFEYWTEGIPLIVDPGTYAYSSDVEARNRFRSVQAHNTIEVDGLESAAFTALWRVAPEQIRPVIERWSSDTETDILKISRTLQGTVARRVKHVRTFEFARSTGTLRINDELTGDEPFDMLISFHTQPDVQVEVEHNNGYILRDKGRIFRLRFSEGHAEASEDWHSPSYGVRQQTNVIRLRRHIQSGYEMTTTIESVAP